MKKEEYYNENTFFNCNSEVMIRLEKFCNKNKVPKYVVITKAIKEFLPGEFSESMSEKLLK